VRAAVLHFLPDEYQPAAAVAALVAALPPGSYLVASHATGEHIAESTRTGATRAYRSSGVPFQTRDSEVFAKLAFGGLDLVPPGVVLVSEWRPGADAGAAPGAACRRTGCPALTGAVLTS
jgi:hypothetical protein